MDKKPDLYIICAGMGSRMGGSIPKALVKITDKPNLTTTLQQIGHKFGHVFVVTNENNQGPWVDYFVELSRDFPELYNNVINTPIKSGRGDGHAVMMALAAVKACGFDDLTHDIVIAWGDVFFPHAEIIDELLAATLVSGIVPVVWEKNPYVAIKAKEWGEVLHAEFSKHGEVNDAGYHDQSLFRFRRGPLERILHSVHHVIDKNGTYITTGAEFSLLHIFHYIQNSNVGSLVQDYVNILKTEYPTRGFNTPEEVAQIQQEIHNKWTTVNRS